MNKRLLAILKWLWSSVAAFVALVAIVVAFVVGSRMGYRSDATPNDHSDEDRVTSSAEGDGDRIALYTCSMHPQVQLPDPDAKCPICFMDLIPVVDAAIAGSTDRILTLTPEAVALAEIETTVADRYFPQGQVRLFGRFEVDETRVATISADFAGRIDELHVDYLGKPVEAGEPLAEVYSPELLAAQQEFKLAIAQNNNAHANTSNTIRKMYESRLHAVREKFRLWGLSAQQIDDIAASDTLLERLTIRAPFDGIVTRQYITQGEYFKTGNPLLEVTNLGVLWMQLEAYESQLPSLYAGQKVSFTVQSVPGQTFEGEIVFVDPILQERTRITWVRVEVDNSKHLFKPGMFVQAEAAGQFGLTGVVQGSTSEMPPVVIPVSAALVTGKRAIVYVQHTDHEQPTFEGREIILGPRVGDVYIVRSGLIEGDVVVTHGAFKIDSALQISAKPSMMNPIVDDIENAQNAKEVDGESVAAISLGLLAEFRPVYDTYFELHIALADDDLDRYNQGRASFLEVVQGLDVTGAKRSVRESWQVARSTVLQALQSVGSRNELESAAKVTFADIADARRRFQRDSQAIIDIAQIFGHSLEQPIYVQSCPMAFGSEEALWLSADQSILNPYLGHVMQQCGAVEERIDSVHLIGEKP